MTWPVRSSIGDARLWNGFVLGLPMQTMQSNKTHAWWYPFNNISCVYGMNDLIPKTKRWFLSCPLDTRLPSFVTSNIRKRRYRLIHRVSNIDQQQQKQRTRLMPNYISSLTSFILSSTFFVCLARFRLPRQDAIVTRTVHSHTHASLR